MVTYEIRQSDDGIYEVGHITDCCKQWEVKRHFIEEREAKKFCYCMNSSATNEVSSLNYDKAELLVYLLTSVLCMLDNDKYPSVQTVELIKHQTHIDLTTGYGESLPLLREKLAELKRFLDDPPYLVKKDNA